MDRAAMRFHQVPHDCESESESPVQPRAGSVRLPESIKDVGKKVGLDSNSRIRYPDLRVAWRLPEFHENAAVRRRKFDRVRKQVPYDLLKTVRISRQGALYRAQLYVNLNALGFACRSNRLHGSLNYNCEVHQFHVEVQLAAQSPGNVE